MDRAPKENRMTDEVDDMDPEQVPREDNDIEQQLEVLGKHGKDLASAAEKEISAAFSKVSAKVSESMGALEKQTQGMSQAFSSWWSSLDGFRDGIEEGKQIAEEERDESQEVPVGALEKIFGLEPTEDLLEAFQCVLLQNYACTHNSFTPPKMIEFQGVLYITSDHVCFNHGDLHSEDPDSQFRISRSEIVSVDQERIEGDDGKDSPLRLSFRDDHYILLSRFKDGRRSRVLSVLQENRSD